MSVAIAPAVSSTGVSIEEEVIGLAAGGDRRVVPASQSAIPTCPEGYSVAVSNLAGVVTGMFVPNVVHVAVFARALTTFSHV